MNWLSAMSRKKRLKKNLNWLKRTTGTKVTTLYFVLLSLLPGKCRVGSVCPFRNIYLACFEFLPINTFK